MVDGWLHDFRFACRGLVRRKGATAIVVMTIGLAIGANTAVFSVVRPVLLESLPYGNEERLVRVGPGGLLPHAKVEALAMEERVPAFQEVAAWSRSLFLLGGDGEPEEVRGALVFANHFDMLGVEARLGRGFHPEDGEPGAHPVVILSHRLWERRYGGDPALVGRDILVSGSPRTVVGVLDRYHHPIEFDWDVWAPMSRDPAENEHSGMAVNALLAPGATAEAAGDQVRAVLTTFWREQGVDVGDEDPAAGGVVELSAWALGDVRRPTVVLMAGVAFVLLLACANVANLLMSLGNTRGGELSIRRALGAGRRRIARLLALEYSLVGLLGCLVGLGLAAVAVTLGRSLLPADFPRLESIEIRGSVILFAAALSAGATLLFGLGPSLGLRRGNLAQGVRSGGRTGSDRAGDRRLQSALVGLQVALAVLLVTGSTLTLRSLWKLTRVDPGFDVSQVVVLRPAPPPGRYSTDAETIEYQRRILEAVAAASGVTSVGSIQFLPMTPGGWNSRYGLPERPLASDALRPGVSMRVVGGDYFQALRIPVLSGRTFTPDDDEGGSIIVNDALAAEAWPGEEAVGRTIVVMDTPFRVVGVVAGSRQHALASPATPEAYLPMALVPWRRMWITARVEGPVPAGLDAVLAAARGVDGEAAMTGAGSLDAIVSGTAADSRFFASSLTALGTLALLLGSIGVYGVLSHMVSRTVRDIGVRMAFGADRGSVVRLTLRKGLTPVVGGIVVGVLISAVGSRTLEALLFGVEPLDPITFLAVPGLLLVAGAAASWFPARRAARTQPVSVLNSE